MHPYLDIYSTFGIWTVDTSYPQIIHCGDIDEGLQLLLR